MTSPERSASFVRLFRRFGPFIGIAAALVALKWPPVYDLEAYLEGAKAVAAGTNPYQGVRDQGIAAWGQGQVYISPPPLAHLLAPFSGLPLEVLYLAWTLAGGVVLLGAITLLDRDTLVARAPWVPFAFTYLWGSIVLGQVNLFVLAGLLLALGSRRDAAAGLGLALAIGLRATPAAFVLVLLLERRWAALAWAAAGTALLVLPWASEWVAFVGLVRDAASLPTAPVVVQTSVAPWPVLWAACTLAVAVVVAAAAVTRKEVTLLAGTAIGLALLLLPSNAWHHWLSFALAPLMLFADRHAWSQRALLGFVGVSFIAVGVPSQVLALVVLAVVTALSAAGLREPWRQFRAGRAGILRSP